MAPAIAWACEGAHVGNQDALEASSAMQSLVNLLVHDDTAVLWAASSANAGACEKGHILNKNAFAASPGAMNNAVALLAHPDGGCSDMDPACHSCIVAHRCPHAG